MNCNIVYIGFSFLHHKNTHAGYDKIKNFFPYDKVFDVQKFHEAHVAPKSLIGKVTRRITKFFLNFDGIPWFLISCIKYGRRNPNTIFHFVYGENLYADIKCFLNPNNKIVCTFHQPFDWFVAHPRFINSLRKLDAIILVGNAEIDKFSALTGKKNVFYIPHGVCTDFYKPEPSIKKEHMILTVGNWLRDYNFANRVYQELLDADPELQINIVASFLNKKSITPHPRIHFYNGISDDELKALYCRCSVLYLPLIRFTANNALLEAAATGCNIVISSDFADNSYIPENYITIVRMNVEETVKQIRKSYSENYNHALSEFVEEHYSWKKIAKQTLDILRKIDK